MSNYSDSAFTDDPNTPWFKVLNLIPEKSKVLDIGCSSGNFDSVIINQKQAVVDGLELDKNDAEAAASKLRKVLNLNVESDDLSGLDSNYDIIYFGDVIEHLFNPVATLKRIKKLLAPGGSVIFSIPNMAHISVRIMLLGGSFDYGNTGLLDKTHLHFYDRNEIERVFQEAGYAIESLDWVSRDVPREILQKQLKNLGLSGEDKFYKASKAVDAAAYQFIGKAAPSKAATAPVKLKKISPEVNVFEKHLLSTRKAYEEELDKSKARYDKALSDYTNNVAAYENSLSWRVTKPLRKISSLVKGFLR